MKASRFFLAGLFLLVFTSVFFGGLHVANAVYGNHQTPKLLNLWFGWFLTAENVQELKKWDFVVLDMDQQVRNPERIRELKKLNPNIKIIAYVDSSNIAAGRYVSDTRFPGYKLAHSLPEEWFLHREKERVGYWPGAWTMNMTRNGPTDSNGKRWGDYLPEFIEKEMWSTGLWDGIFLDNAIIGPTWFAGNGLDMTGDGKADADSTVNEAWKQGWILMVQNLRKRLGSNAVIMGNGAHEYSPYTNAILFEDVPNYGWVEAMTAYQFAMSHNQKPAMSAINSNANNVQNPADYRAMRLGFTTALLDDGYFSFDYGNQDHGQTWWYDEYDVNLGKPIGTATLKSPAGRKGVVEGVWWREYENGAVVVNSTRSPQSFALDGVYERLRGSQDTSVNNGRLETSVSLPARDGVVLYRRTEAKALTQSTSIQNGSFFRVYNANGEQVRSSFFSQRSDVPSGSIVASNDLDQDGKSDVVSASAGVIRIKYGSGAEKMIRPYGTAYTGALQFSIGNMDRDKDLEIAVGREGSDETLVLDRDGSVRARWKAYAGVKVGVNVAVGNLDGDDKREVVTGAGPTGGPHVRIFKTDGLLWSKGFFAFDKRERGGVNIAVGDVNGDGKDEIVAGSGQGTLPRVRIFNWNGDILKEFSLGATVSARGVGVSLSDIDGNGTLEILASGIQITP